MIPALAYPAIRHPGEQFQQVTAHIRDRDRHDRLCRCGHGSTNDRLTHDEAPVAGICERTPVPTGAPSIPRPDTPLMITSQHPAANRGPTLQKILERPCAPEGQPDLRPWVWSVSGGATGIRPSVWSVNGGATGIRPSVWSVNGGATGIRPSVWSVSGGATRLRPSVWSVSGGATRLRPLMWSVNGGGTGIRPLAWSVNGGGTGLRPLMWSVNGGGSGLRPLLTGWSFARPVVSRSCAVLLPPDSCI